MLTSLRIKNLALASDLSVEFGPAYNAITGETGAGKSLLIGGLNLVLGGRADRSLLRAGEDSCAVEAVFEISRIARQVAVILEENGLESCEDGHLLIKRVLAASGANRQFINGSPTTLATLAALGALLVDIHGPHDHQSLLHPAQQLAILDAFGGLAALKGAVAGLVRERQKLEEAKAGLIVDEESYARQLDLLEFQAGEIEAARLQPGEECDLEKEWLRVRNATRLAELSQSALAILDGDEGSLLTQMGSLGKILQELRKMDSGAEPLAGLHKLAVDQLAELRGELSSYAEKLEIDPGRAAELEERVSLIQSLKRKYGPSVAAVIEFGAQARAKLTALQQRDIEVARLNGDISKALAQLNAAAAELTAARKKLVPKLAKAVIRELMDLGFRQSHFEIALTPAPISSAGAEGAEFLFAPNPGEPPQPLRAIASSGEMARVMLAIKTVLAVEDQIPVLVFDEVDANVGGETAAVVGEKMRRIGAQRQVLCITHLPPVAAAAARHFIVAKEVRDGRTYSKVRALDQGERVTELARMLGGQSAAARRHAEEMLSSNES